MKTAPRGDIRHYDLLGVRFVVQTKWAVVVSLRRLFVVVHGGTFAGGRSDLARAPIFVARGDQVGVIFVEFARHEGHAPGRDMHEPRIRRIVGVTPLLGADRRSAVLGPLFP